MNKHIRDLAEQAGMIVGGNAGEFDMAKFMPKELKFAEVLFESNNLAEACSFVYDDWKLNKRDIAVYQPRSQGYRDIYQNPARNAKGQFIAK